MVRRVEARDAYRPPPAREPAPLSRRALLRLRFSAQARAEIDYDGVTERVRAGWEAADGRVEQLLRALEPAARAAVELAGVEPGAEVDACDLAGAMVARGSARCRERVRWTQADVQELPYHDGSFDVVVSAFGGALAPRARRTAHELARVLRPGGRLVLAAWAPRGLPGRLDEHVALPDGVRAPTDWADEETARRRFEPVLEGLERRSRTVALAFPDADAMFDALTLPLGLPAGRRAALRPAFERLLAAQSNRPPEAEIDARYVLYAGR